MRINLLCIGDVVGGPGRRVLQEQLPKLVEERKVDGVIVNAENATDGAGLSAQACEKVLSCGVHVITLGDHVYRRKDIIPVMEKSDRVVRPANLPSQAPGKEFAVFHTSSNQPVAVLAVLGRMFMRSPVDCPLATVDRVMGLIPREVKIIVIDVHAEATSEKVALGWHVDGRASVVFGTHTHIPTADERVLPKGTAYISDVGMTGPYDSVLGRDKTRVVGTMLSGVPSHFDVADGDARLCGVLVSVESTTGRAAHIERIRVDG